MDRTTRARLQILGAALLFATGGAAIKATSLGGWQVAMGRSVIAGVTLLLLDRSARRGWGQPRTWAVGLAYALTLVLFVVANKLTTAAHTIFLQSTSPLYVLVLSPWLLGERWQARDLAVVAGMGVGMTAFFASAEPATALATHPALGNLLGAASGLTWALTVMGLRWLARPGAQGQAATTSASSAAAVGSVLSAALAAPMAWSTWSWGTGVDWAVLAYLGVFQIGASYGLMSRAAPELPALEVSLLLLLEPVASAVVAYVVHGETVGPLAVAGAAVILGSLGLHAGWARRRRGGGAAGP